MNLKLIDVKKSYSGNVIFENVNLDFKKKDFVGVIGDNGDGKSTLLKIIAEKVKPDSGEVRFSPQNIEIRYIPQFLELHENESIEEYYLGCFQVEDLKEIYKEILRLSKNEGKNDIDSSKIIDIQQQFEDYEGYNLLSKLIKYLERLNLGKYETTSKLNELSGGEKTRLQLLQVLISIDKSKGSGGGEVLLLDEPTNNLDSSSIELLQSLLSSRHSIGNLITVMVSHNRSLLNKCSKIVDIKDKTAKLYKGNYEEYEYQKNLTKNINATEYKKKRKEFDRLKHAAVQRKDRGKSIKSVIKSRRGDGITASQIRKSEAKASRQARVLFRRADREIRKASKYKPEQQGTDLQLNFKSLGESGEVVLQINEVCFGYRKSGNLEQVLDRVSLEILRGERISISGDNGAGKSTLLKLINDLWIKGENSDFIVDQDRYVFDGDVGFGEKLRVGYISQEHYDLQEKNNNIIKEFSVQTNISKYDSRIFLQNLLFGKEQVHTPVCDLSQGEKVRFKLGVILKNECNFIILDEPTNHMDMKSIEVLEEALRNYDGTLLIVSHDKKFVENIGVNKTFVLENGRLVGG